MAISENRGQTTFSSKNRVNRGQTTDSLKKTEKLWSVPGSCEWLNFGTDVLSEKLSAPGVGRPAFFLLFLAGLGLPAGARTPFAFARIMRA